jgi:hypothetical protein
MNTQPTRIYLDNKGVVIDDYHNGLIGTDKAYIREDKYYDIVKLLGTAPHPYAGIEQYARWYAWMLSRKIEICERD